MYLPEGRPPRVGEVLKHEDLSRTLQFLADEEKAQAGRGREAGLAAARQAFYRGDIAATIATHQKENGGLMTAEDMADFRVGIEPPIRTTFGDVELWGCGPWCQGPMLLQALNILEGMDLKGNRPQLGGLSPHRRRGHQPGGRRPPRLLRRPPLRRCAHRQAVVQGIRQPTAQADPGR